MLLLATAQATAERLRIASYNVELSREGPGVLLRDIAGENDAQIHAVLAVLDAANADIVAVQNFDYDQEKAALSLFAERANYPHFFALRPNTGILTGHDLDGDGRTTGPRDAQGYGVFSGQGGMAILSRHPIAASEAIDFSDLLWREMPAGLPILPDGTPVLPPEIAAVQRLSTTGHWIVPIDVAGSGRIYLMTFHATPPVFDGPEDRNGHRNHDEIRFWSLFLDGSFGPAPDRRFALLGDFNLDPAKGEGRKTALGTLLADPRIQDTGPEGARGQATVDWQDPVPGDLRVDYVLPSADWQVLDSGVLWPEASNALSEIVAKASRHRLVWVDVQAR